MIEESVITRFLEGKSPKKYIVGIEVPYGRNEARLIINDPNRGKSILKEEYPSFLWFKEEATKLMYKGSRYAISEAAKKYGVTITKLKTIGLDGRTPERMANGYKYIAKIDGSFAKLQRFFKDGGLEVYGEKDKHLFMAVSPVEQYMIATGKRLFKGMDYYDDVHRLQFDIETTGLNAVGTYLSRREIEEIKAEMSDENNTEDFTKLYEFDANGPIRHKDDEIFQIGIKDNRGFETILEAPTFGTKEERKNGEIYLILKFFSIINELKPDIIVGFNSEFFDWTFIEERCKVHEISIEFACKTLDPENKELFKRVNKSIKLGGEQENYRQTVMWGYNIVDASHAVRRAKAINSNIKKWGLKYITKFSELNKPNRVYVKGDQIYKIWADTITDYAFNDTDGTYYIISDEKPITDGYVKVKGNAIIRRYLLDDLWETEKVDGMYNQAAYLLAKIIPTNYGRSTTMGTAGIWKLIMAAWSYEKGLAIPDTAPQKTFTGGLSRLLEVGFARNVAKLDYAALYPNIELTWDVFPDTDISGAMRGLLLYIANTRDTFKNLTNVHKGITKSLKAYLSENSDILTEETVGIIKKEIEDNGLLASIYDKKQLPIKILGNSFFGSLGAPNIFNWGDTDSAEKTTCIGRQSFRLMADFFVKRHFRVLVGDTDGINFSIPDNINDYKYTPNGTHRFTEKNKDIEISGLLAVVAEFNEKFMIGRMGLDIDDICESTINFSRKNYGNLINGKVKLVGNTIKSSRMPIYIEEFLDKAIQYLLDGNGYEFIQLYHRTVEDIDNFRVPLVKIASKANVKQTVSQYNADMLTKTKNGSSKSKKAYMELLIRAGIKPSIGSTVYYVNIGNSKSQGDVQNIPTIKMTKKEKELYFATHGKSPDLKPEVKLNCKLIPTDQIENNPDLTTDEYNVPKYLEAFNKRIHPLLVCFNTEIREKILVSMIKNKKTKEMELTPFNIFTKKECELTSGDPFKEKDQDNLVELFTMEDKEIEFWMRVNEEPTFTDELNMNWDEIKADYIERKRIEKINGIIFEKGKVLELIKRLEVKEILSIRKTSKLTKSLELYCDLNIHNDKNDEPVLYLTSKKWGANLYNAKMLFKYEAWANDRNLYYLLPEILKKNKTYEDWLRYKYTNAVLANDEKVVKGIGDEMALSNVEIPKIIENKN